MAKPTVTKNPRSPTQGSPAEPGNLCGESWHYALRVKEGRFSKELDPIAPFDVALSPRTPSYSFDVVAAWIDTGSFQARYAKVLEEFIEFSNQGLIGEANQKSIGSIFERAARYYNQASALRVYMSSSPFASERLKDEGDWESIHKLLGAALRNLRCAEEGTWVVALHAKNKKSTRGSVLARPEGPPSSNYVPQDTDEPQIEFEPGPEDEPAPTPAPKKSNMILLLGAAAVGLLLLSKK